MDIKLNPCICCKSEAVFSGYSGYLEIRGGLWGSVSVSCTHYDKPLSMEYPYCNNLVSYDFNADYSTVDSGVLVATMWNLANPLTETTT